MAEDALLRRWVATWQRAGVELERIRWEELRALDTKKAVRQIFSDLKLPLPPVEPTSGLVEQQAWFARLREARQHRQRS